MIKNNLITLIYKITFLVTSVLAITTFATENTSHQKSAVQGQWIHSDKLKPDMKILTADNNILTIEQGWEPNTNTATTYNLEVANAHTYFVGDQKFFVHNMADCKDLLNRVKNWWRNRGAPKTQARNPQIIPHHAKLVPEIEKTLNSSSAINFRTSTDVVDEGLVYGGS